MGSTAAATCCIDQAVHDKRHTGWGVTGLCFCRSFCTGRMWSRKAKQQHQQQPQYLHVGHAVLQANGHEGRDGWPDAQDLAGQRGCGTSIPDGHAHQPVGHHGADEALQVCRQYNELYFIFATQPQACSIPVAGNSIAVCGQTAPGSVGLCVSVLGQRVVGHNRGLCLPT